MKKTRNILAIVLALSIFVSLAYGLNITSESTLGSNLTELEVATMRQTPAVEAFEQLCKEFKIDQRTRDFPDGYGGAYISSDDALVIKIVVGYEFLKKNIQSTFQNCIIRFEYTDISLYDLFALSDSVIDQLDGNNGVINKVTISQKDSQIKLGVDSKSLLFITEEIDAKLLLDNIHISISESFSAPTASLIGGERLYRSASGILHSHGTLGFSGTYNGQWVIVTAGHVSKNETLYFGYGNAVGAKLKEVYYDQGTGDYAIIKINNTSTNLPTNQIYTGSGMGPISSYSLDYNTLDNQQVFKYGITTGLTLGVVTGYNPYVSYNNYDGTNTQVHGLIEVAAYNGAWCNQGDSGGPVCRILANGTREAMGIVSGEDSYYGGQVSYYSPLYHISGFVPKLY